MFDAKWAAIRDTKGECYLAGCRLGARTMYDGTMHRNTVQVCLLALAVVVAALPAYGADAYSGEVVSVTDGDTITVLVGETQHKVRLEGIDCPEKKQAFGNRARQYTADVVFGKTVRVNAKSKDRYRRDIGQVYVDTKHVNAELIRAGMAWHYRQYSTDTEFARLEQEARKKKKGLWIDKNPIPPWEFRKPPLGRKHD